MWTVDPLVVGFVISVALDRYCYLAVRPVDGSHMALHTRLGECPQCRTEREVYVTAAWQPDLCSHCGADVEDESS